MASVSDLCWTTSADLFRDVDLDFLYLRQLDAMRVKDREEYPFHLLVFTGKITIGINLANRFEGSGCPSLFERGRVVSQDDPLKPWDR
jgi:hypothetical protein